jgi:hypothetical protein
MRTLANVIASDKRTARASSSPGFVPGHLTEVVNPCDSVSGKRRQCSEAAVAHHGRICQARRVRIRRRKIKRMATKG